MGLAVDRISDLPDTIKLQILCLLPRKFAVRTGVLSTRWRQLWRYRWPYVTTLIIGEEFCPRLLSQEEFECRINEFLKVRGNKKVEILQLFSNPTSTWQYQSNNNNIVSWIEYAISNGVEELYLDFSSGFKHGKSFKIPNNLLCCSSLTVLSLNSCKLNQQPGLNFVEKVNLKCVNITDRMILDMTDNCSCLQSLDLRQCLELRSIKIRGKDLRLKSLIVVDCCKAYEIEIFAPNLRSFHFSGEFLNKYTFRNVSSLSDAMMSSFGKETASCQANWEDIIRDLAHVKVLTLCCRAIQQIVLLKQSAQIVLGNLEELQLLMDLVTETNLSDIFDFFGKCHCPKLNKVFIELPTCTRNPWLENFLNVPLEEPRKCDFSSLKVIKMNNFKGYENEVDLARFFLEKITELELMILVISNETDPMFPSSYHGMMHPKLLQKVSRKAKLVICNASEDTNGCCATHYDVYCKIDECLWNAYRSSAYLKASHIGKEWNEMSELFPKETHFFETIFPSNPLLKLFLWVSHF